MVLMVWSRNVLTQPLHVWATDDYVPKLFVFPTCIWQCVCFSARFPPHKIAHENKRMRDRYVGNVFESHTLIPPWFDAMVIQFQNFPWNREANNNPFFFGTVSHRV